MVPFWSCNGDIALADTKRDRWLISGVPRELREAALKTAGGGVRP
jgi:hypothetical protein